MLGVSGLLCAQETPRFAFSAGAGFTTPVGRTSNIVDTGWNIRAGAGVNFNHYAGLMLDLGYDQMGISSPILNNLSFGGGSLSIFSATLNPIVHLSPTGSRADVYITGGGGLYRQNREFTQPGVSNGIGFDPFFGFYPYAAPVDIVVSSYSVVKPGVNAGMGIAFGSKWGGKFFAEARYNRIFLGNRHTDYIPVTFGFRR